MKNCKVCNCYFVCGTQIKNICEDENMKTAKKDSGKSHGKTGKGQSKNPASATNKKPAGTS